MAKNEEVRNLAAALTHLGESIRGFLERQETTDASLVGPVGVKGKRLLGEAHEFAADLAATLHEIKFLPPPEKERRASFFVGRVAMVSVDDLKGFFAGKRWKGEFKDGGYRGTYPGDVLTYSVDISPNGTTFYYKVWAKDDPTDYEEGVSDEPIKSLAEFVGYGVPGGEVFERMSSDPSAAAKLLRDIASGRPDPKSLRRFSAAIASIRARRADSEGLGSDEIGKLLKTMKSKGWQVSKTEVDGNPAVHVAIGDEFEADIEVSDISYSFEFGVDGKPDLTQRGTTDDPIREFQRFYRSPEVEQSYEEAKSSKSESMDRGTVPSGPRRKTPPEETGT